MAIKTTSLLPGALLISLSPAIAGVELTECGQVIPPRGVVDLVVDLDCTGTPYTGLLLHRGRLRLNGHQLRGVTVWCEMGRGCRIIGPGEIVGGGSIGTCVSDSWDRTTIRDVTIRDCPGYGIDSGGTRVTKLVNVVVTGSGSHGVYGGKLVRLENVTLTGNLGWGVMGLGSVVGADVVASGNGSGIQAVYNMKLERITATENHDFGVSLVGHEGQMLLTVGNITGNSVDVSSAEPPSLTDVQCEHSANPEGGNWGVCTLD